MMRKVKRKRNISVVFKSVFGIVLLLTVFSVIVSAIGFNGFTDALLTQYGDGAFRTADIALTCLDPDRIDAYAASGGETEEYQQVWERLERLCNSSGVTFIYVIRPDLTDYGHITFLFSTINDDSGYTPYEFGFVRETTNDSYRAKYRNLYEGLSEQELEVRDKGYIETDPHITAMVPVRDSKGQTEAILCVQRQMDTLVHVRRGYLMKVLTALIITAVLVIAGQTVYLHLVLLRPLKRITKEASRFAEENKAAPAKLRDTVRNRDEIGTLASSVDGMEEKLLHYMDDLTRITAEKERISTELSLAARIQSSMLPNLFPAFPERQEFDIYASMTPAKEVGGDFYDFFLVDDDHLCLCIADVSGKGIPAALFMMASRIVLANYARMGKSPGEILTEANTAICAHNKEDMFVTVWLGILTISTGTLTAASAGHEYPFLMKEGRFALFRDKHGFVLGGMEGMRYKQYEIRLEAGDKLFLYTDGVPEATDSQNQSFGTDRMLNALNEQPDAPPQEILRNVRKAVDGFVGEAEQFDDLTMLCLSYQGDGAGKEEQEDEA